MKESSIKTQQETLCRELANSLECLLSAFNNYLNSFEVKDFFTFSGADKRVDFYKSNYSKLREDISAPAEKATAIMGNISSLLIESDITGMADTTALLQNIFDKYITLEALLSAFIKETNAALKEEKLSITRMSDSAKKVCLAISSLKSNLK